MTHRATHPQLSPAHPGTVCRVQAAGVAEVAILGRKVVGEKPIEPIRKSFHVGAGF